MSGNPGGGVVGNMPMSGAGPLGNTPALGNGPAPMASATQGMPPQGMPNPAMQGASQWSPAGIAPGMPPWSPAFSQQSAANQGNTNAIYPQLTGGAWNQYSQMMAGPQYRSNAPIPQAPAMGPHTAGTPNYQTAAIGSRMPGYTGIFAGGGRK